MQAMLTHMPFDALLILLPLAAGMLCFLWPAIARLLGILTTAAGVASVAGLGWQLQDSSGSLHHAIGGWNAPLGIGLFADGLSLLMLAATALVGFAVSIYATGYFTRRHDEIRFWPIWLLLLGALNALFLAADIFNLYVTLELMGLAAVALAALTGGKQALAGAMRYLLATLLGSMCYLLGVALLYHSFGSVDIETLAVRMESTPAVWAALGLISTGLALKTALFPLHFWLPPAHASAPTPVSALLSALVVKASFYILLRLWLSIFSSLGDGIDTLLGLLGATAVLWGSIQALRQTRLKLLIAYSTVAQIGYLFLAFPLAAATGGLAWNGVAYLALSHALAKAAMFLSAGNLLRYGGHDRIADLDRVVQRLPLTAGAFALAGVSIMGLPPSGGFVGKWLLLQAALEQGHWGIILVLLVGGLLAAAYIFKVLGPAFTLASHPHEPSMVPARMEWAALLLALGAILLGFMATSVLEFINIGDVFVTPEVRS
ncbi:MAG: proton-conducting transporter membrane subunit [Gammaproteobacteria bacterium]|nr:proton-conducting transporter membrane subunit [Gammaproteobacteria bacterium]